jgi:xanthine dehydrogenase molybdenum-binding subunit
LPESIEVEPGQTALTPYVVLDQRGITLIAPRAEMGQGIHTVARQILAEVAGLDDAVTITVKSTTSANATSGTTTASRGTALLGNSTLKAALDLKADLEDRTLADLVGREYFGRHVIDWTTRHDVKGEIVSHFSYGFAVHFAILDESGRLKGVHAAHDAGTVINPTLFEGQIEGGVVMGMGYALSERLPLEAGRLTSTRMAKLGLPKAKDIPEINVISAQSPDPVGPFGAKGVGEIGTIPTAPAIANAYFQFDGVRRYKLPLTPLKKSSSEPKGK